MLTGSNSRYISDETRVNVNVEELVSSRDWAHRIVTLYLSSRLIPQFGSVSIFGTAHSNAIMEIPTAVMERRGSAHASSPFSPAHGRSKSLGGVIFGGGGVPMSPGRSAGSPIMGGGSDSEYADIQAR